MKNFNVLDRSTNVFKSHILEASAGTGKTFSIENLVTRLLTEGDYTLPQILIVTFTKKAAQELRERVHQNIQQSLKNILSKKEVPDYLKQLLEVNSPGTLVKTLKRALLAFDEAQIYTIHAFCLRALQSHTPQTSLKISDKDLDNQQIIIDIIKDYLRAEISSDKFDPHQIARVMKKYGPLDKLILNLVRSTSKEGVFAKTPDFKITKNSLIENVKSLQKTLPPEQISEEWQQIIGNSPEISSRKNIRKELKKQILLLSQFLTEGLFDGLLELELDFIHTLKCPKTILGDQISTKIAPLLCQICDVNASFLKMTAECRERIDSHMQKQGQLTSDLILKQTAESLSDKSFVTALRKSYRAVIIDEFQDTDQIQWNIFSSIFLEGGQLLYLIGDPKQSIYSFRNADIYTYLKAITAMGSDHLYSLNTNFRSQAGLVRGLNKLFKNTSFNLPRHNTKLNYQPVLFHHQENNIPDGKGSIHLFLSEVADSRSKTWPTEQLEKSTIFPFISNELSLLHKKHHIAYQDCAILVRDRYQAARLKQFLEGRQIPSKTKYSQAISETPLIKAFSELLRALETPKNINTLKTFLGGYWLQCSSDEIVAVEDEIFYLEIIEQLYRLRKILTENSITSFWEKFLYSQWFFNENKIIENISKRENGLEQINMAEAVVHLLASSFKNNIIISELIDLLEKVEQDPQSYSLNTAQDEESVEIMTMHISKGLEYEVVFALGIANRTKLDLSLTPEYSKEKTIWIPHGSNRILDEQLKEEVDAEKMRQLYVALTRAKRRLYIPTLYNKEGSSPNDGSISPIELFWKQNGLDMSPDNIIHKLDSIKNNDISYEILASQTDPFIPNNSHLKLLLEPIKTSRRPLYTYNKPYLSFSSISQSKNQHEKQYILTNPPHNFDNDIKDSHTLPAGSETGTLLHAILEKIELPLKESKKLEELINTHTIGTPFESWQRPIFNMLNNILSANIKINEEAPFALKDLSASDIVRETEFLKSEKECNMVGFIDMLFRYQGRYYILDWKSNWLGEDDKAYSREKMNLAMEQHDYYLQAEIYSTALKNYLKLFEKKPFKEIFGGAIYCFLRGADNGFLYFKPRI